MFSSIRIIQPFLETFQPLKTIFKESFCLWLRVDLVLKLSEFVIFVQNLNEYNIMWLSKQLINFRIPAISIIGVDLVILKKTLKKVPNVNNNTTK